MKVKTKNPKRKNNKRENNKKNLFKLFPLLLLTSLILFSSFFFSNKLGKKLKRFFPTPSTKKNFIANIIQKEGQVFLKQKNELDFKLLKPNQESLYASDRIQTSKNSSLILEFPSRHQIKILELSSVRMDWWISNKPPAYLYFSSGDYNLIYQGKKGELFILKNKKLFIPSERPKTQKPNFLMTKNLETTPLPTLPSSTLPSSTFHLSNPQSNKKKSNTINTMNAMNADIELDIESEILKIREKLKKCQWNSFRKKEPSQGEILLGLNIKPTGEIKNIQMIQSSFNQNQSNSKKFKNLNLESCVLSVFKRLQLKPFNGPEVYKVYPIKFE